MATSYRNVSHQTITVSQDCLTPLTLKPLPSVYSYYPAADHVS